MLKEIDTAEQLVSLLIIRKASVEIQCQAYRIQEAMKHLNGCIQFGDMLVHEAEQVEKLASSFGVIARNYMPKEHIYGVEAEKKRRGYDG